MKYRNARRQPQPTDQPDTVAAIELVIATLEGRFSLNLLRDMNKSAVVTGLIHLVTVLGEQIAPDAETFRRALRDLQAHQRLEALFGTEGEDHD